MSNLSIMKKPHLKKKEREKIAYEYLNGGKSLIDLNIQYGISTRSIYRWVKKFEQDYSKIVRSSLSQPTAPAKDIGANIKQMQEELDKARLHNLLLEELLKIGKEQYGIDLRKKTGAKQS
jgi:transposase-like protein